jgi:hypothetical protein
MRSGEIEALVTLCTAELVVRFARRKTITVWPLWELKEKLFVSTIVSLAVDISKPMSGMGMKPRCWPTGLQFTLTLLR